MLSWCLDIPVNHRRLDAKSRMKDCHKLMPSAPGVASGPARARRAATQGGRAERFRLFKSRKPRQTGYPEAQVLIQPDELDHGLATAGELHQLLALHTRLLVAAQ